MNVFDVLREKINNQKENDELHELYASPQGALDDTLEIVNWVEQKYNAAREKVVSELLKGEWVDTEDVEKYLGISFSLGMKLFDFSRTAAWNPAPLNGQSITTKFRVKKKDKPKTNADRIRAMSDEELAEFIANDCLEIADEICGSCTQETTERCGSGCCVEHIVSWLQKEVEKQ